MEINNKNESNRVWYKDLIGNLSVLIPYVGGFKILKYLENKSEKK